MTQESGKKSSVLVLHADPSGNGEPSAYSEDDDSWRAFLEYPLTAASKAMMSVSGDEDSANALGLLYDYYKVPRDKTAAGQSKVFTVDADSNKLNFMVPYQDSPLAMTTLRTVPLHTVVQGSPLPQDKKSVYSTTDSMVSIPATGIPIYSGNLEGPLQAYHGVLPGINSSQSDGIIFSRQLNHGQFSSRHQTLTPTSTYAEVLSHSEDLQLHMASISPEDYPTFSSSSSKQLEYVLEAPQSLRPKSGSSQMSYLNKGQFYPISLKDLNVANDNPHTRGRVRSVIMLVFGDDKFTDDQLKHWRYWHSRQHTAKQRCIDIADYKESFNTISNIDEIAYNAISFTWDTKDEARIFVSVHCLSTDFSPQKGVRGLPLNLQIDTYSCGGHGANKLVHRAYSQIKVFCDKGAERKIRDEDRKQSRRKMKTADAVATYGKVPLHTGHLDVTVFKPMSDMESQPVLFTPEVQFSSAYHRHNSCQDEDEDSLGQKRLIYHTEEEFDTANKKFKREASEKVLLYVRVETEEVFDALMLRAPTLKGLLEAVSEKYELPMEKLGKVYKRCKKGILVNMDDNIIKHYSNEDAFNIRIEEVGGHILLTLTEI